MTYVTLAFEHGGSVKEVQTLMRHQDPKLTLHTYARARDDRLGKLVEAIGDTVLNPQRTQPADDESIKKAESQIARKAAGAESFDPSTEFPIIEVVEDTGIIRRDFPKSLPTSSFRRNFFCSKNLSSSHCFSIFPVISCRLGESLAQFWHSLGAFRP